MPPIQGFTQSKIEKAKAQSLQNDKDSYLTNFKIREEILMQAIKNGIFSISFVVARRQVATFNIDNSQVMRNRLTHYNIYKDTKFHRLSESVVPYLYITTLLSLVYVLGTKRPLFLSIPLFTNAHIKM